MLLDNWLAQRATTCPDRVAVVGVGGEMTYAQLEAEAASAARRLAGLGVRRGSLVPLELAPGPDHVILLHALMKLGAVAFPVDPRLSAAERPAELNDAPVAISTPEDAGGPEADLPLLGEHDLDAVQCRILTSGTSGVPRSVELTYGNHLWSAVGSAFNLGVDPADRWLCCLPLHHVGGLSIVMRSAIYGTCVDVHERFDAAAVAGALERGGVTIVSLVGTQLARLLGIGARVDVPRVILVGGGPIPVALLGRATAEGATIVQTYGLTEAASQVTTLAPADASRKIGSAGRPLLTTHLRIEDGEILVQGPTVAPSRLDEAGWLHTGDHGWIDEEGFLYVHGRLDDLIVTGGENVVPAEVEAVLADHPGIAEAAVVGREDPEWGQAVEAVLVAAGPEPPGEEELRRHCAATLAAHKVPKRFAFVDELPRTESGKLRRAALR
jgi:O-succinylbenzoic acid--CoA ligase